ncbi:MAG: hypothetical protein M3Q75_05290, partial [Gemmatimonadota bacterium]|nr:hypothetical protein [Gemmatimonadota bacterium]
VYSLECLAAGVLHRRVVITSIRGEHGNTMPSSDQLGGYIGHVLTDGRGIWYVDLGKEKEGVTHVSTAPRPQ